MFLPWCHDELVLSFKFVQILVYWDRTQLRKCTTAETQTLSESRNKDETLSNQAIMDHKPEHQINLAELHYFEFSQNIRNQI